MALLLFTVMSLIFCFHGLKEAESFLTKVEQSPAKSMHDALSPMIKALVADELLRHSNVDVKVALASCLSEITRITAPDAPYDDEKMKVSISHYFSIFFFISTM